MRRSAIVLSLGAAVLVGLLLAFAGRHDAFAQATSGTISGTVLHDVEGDGACLGEPGVPGIPVQFSTSDGFTTVFRDTDGSGAFGLTAAGFGTWIVSAAPPSGWQVTNTGSIQVSVTNEVPNVAGIVFCVTQVEGSSGSGGSGGTTLPESGAPLALPLLIAAIVGGVLVTAGLILLASARRHAH